MASSRQGGTWAFTLLALGCSAAAPTEEARVERGQALFESGELSPSVLNLFSCNSCHDAVPGTDAVLKPGAPLAGATLRPSFWGGQEDDLLRSIDDCRDVFMHASTPLDPTNADAVALYAYLVSLEPGNPQAVPFTVVSEIVDVPRGDATRGAGAYTNVCAQCHGTMHTGYGRLSDLIPILPDDTLAAHPPPDYSPRTQRLVFIEKTRHGGFLDYGGDMPPFSAEVLADTELSDVLEALGVLGE
jgi:thiosulfate dehydrogenase